MLEHNTVDIYRLMLFHKDYEVDKCHLIRGQCVLAHITVRGRYSLINELNRFAKSVSVIMAL